VKLSVSYRADYAYDEPVSLSPHVVRLFPRDLLHARVDTCSFTTNKAADIHWRRDLFDNMVASCFYPRIEQVLTLTLDMEITAAERNPFGFLLESRAMRFPVAYDGRETALLAASFLRVPRELPGELTPADGADTLESLVAMNEWIHNNITYERREEGEAFSPEETLLRGSGACRDTAVLLATALRQRGLASRLASGFLWESASDPGGRKAESALHAWTEVYLPGAGWLALDPSNGVFADHHYLTAAVGLLPGDIAPVEGSYYGDRTIPGRLTTALRIERT
jgi:transglutaminase-like putative cysteine protease